MYLNYPKVSFFESIYHHSWLEAEKACTTALQQHRSSKGLYRRAKAKRMLGRPAEAIQGDSTLQYSTNHRSFSPDLRAVLRLQPANKEALAELESLIPLNNSDVVVVKDNANPSTSKQPSRVESDAEKLRRLCLPKPKPIKQPSFAKTRADEQKLQIISLSALEGSSLNRKASGGNQSHVTNRHGKEKAGASRSKAVKELEQMRTDCQSYPGWDKHRYVVKRAD